MRVLYLTYSDKRHKWCAQQFSWILLIFIIIYTLLSIKYSIQSLRVKGGRKNAPLDRIAAAINLVGISCLIYGFFCEALIEFFIPDIRRTPQKQDMFWKSPPTLEIARVIRVFLGGAW